MGASGWSYIVPFQEDINQALQELRQQEFAAGKYYRPGTFIEMALNRNIVAADEREQLEAALKSLNALPAPLTIEELFEQNGESGTHSIIDIFSVSAAPEFGTVSPLSDEELMEIFGHARPHIDEVLEESKLEELYDRRERWEGLYVICYTNNMPMQIFFCGCSGD